MPFRYVEHASPITGIQSKYVHRRGSEVIFANSYSMPNSHRLRLAGIFRKSYSLRHCLCRFILFTIYFITKSRFCQGVFFGYFEKPSIFYRIYLKFFPLRMFSHLWEKLR